MRPDTRSFSFTWLKGQQKEEEDRVARGGEVSKSTTEDGEGASGGWGAKRGNSGSRLRRLSNSLARLRGGKYSSMDDDAKSSTMDDENWTKISEEPMNLDEDDESDMGDDDDDLPPRRFEYEDNLKKVVSSGSSGMKGIKDGGKMQPDVVKQATQVLDGNDKKEEEGGGEGVALKQVLPMPFKARDNGENGDGASSSSGGMSLGKRLNKTVQEVKASLGNFSQKFRKSTRRRYRMAPGTPGSMASPTKRILGRTPTKLYSPFGIDSPALRKTPKRLADRPSTPRLARKSMVAAMVYSPSNNFRRDLDEARRGMEDFHMITRDITRRSVRF